MGGQKKFTPSQKYTGQNIGKMYTAGESDYLLQQNCLL